MRVQIRKKEGGFSLIEGMVAVGILAGALLAISSGEIQALGSNQRSSEKLRAIAAAEEIIELMRRNVQNAQSLYQNLNTSVGCPAAGAVPTLFDNDCANWRLRVAAVSGATATAPFNCGGVQVSVACGWVVIGAGQSGLQVSLNTATVTIVWPGNPTGITVNTTVKF